MPATLDEARTLVAYNERILATSQSRQRRDRAARMLTNVRSEIARLERAAAIRIKPAQPVSHGDDEFDVVFSGADSLDKFRKDA